MCVRVCMIYYVLLYYYIIYYYYIIMQRLTRHVSVIRMTNRRQWGSGRQGQRDYFGGISWPVEKCHDQLSSKLRVACLVT